MNPNTQIENMIDAWSRLQQQWWARRLLSRLEYERSFVAS
jgi:hypothetical protein